MSASLRRSTLIWTSLQLIFSLARACSIDPGTPPSPRRWPGGEFEYASQLQLAGNPEYLARCSGDGVACESWTDDRHSRFCHREMYTRGKWDRRPAFHEKPHSSSTIQTARKFPEATSTATSVSSTWVITAEGCTRDGAQSSSKNPANFLPTFRENERASFRSRQRFPQTRANILRTRRRSMQLASRKRDACQIPIGEKLWPNSKRGSATLRIRSTSSQNRVPQFRRRALLSLADSESSAGSPSPKSRRIVKKHRGRRRPAGRPNLASRAQARLGAKKELAEIERRIAADLDRIRGSLRLDELLELARRGLRTKDDERLEQELRDLRQSENERGNAAESSSSSTGNHSKSNEHSRHVNITPYKEVSVNNNDPSAASAASAAAGAEPLAASFRGKGTRKSKESVYYDDYYDYYESRNAGTGRRLSSLNGLNLRVSGELGYEPSARSARKSAELSDLLAEGREYDVAVQGSLHLHLEDPEDAGAAKSHGRKKKRCSGKKPKRSKREGEARGALRRMGDEKAPRKRIHANAKLVRLSAPEKQGSSRSFWRGDGDGDDESAGATARCGCEATSTAAPPPADFTSVAVDTLEPETGTEGERVRTRTSSPECHCGSTETAARDSTESRTEPSATSSEGTTPGREPGDELQLQREKIARMRNMLEILTFVKKLEQLMAEGGAAPLRVSDDTGGLEIRLEKMYARPGRNRSESPPAAISASPEGAAEALRKHKQPDELQEEPIEAYVEPRPRWNATYARRANKRRKRRASYHAAR